MKLILAAAAAMIAMPAIAQNTPAPPPPPEPQTAPMPPAAPTPPEAPLPPPAAPGAMVMGQPSPVVQPLSDTTTAPADGSAPWCTKTVVDHCKEHSAPNGARLHTTPRPPGK